MPSRRSQGPSNPANQKNLIAARNFLTSKGVRSVEIEEKAKSLVWRKYRIKRAREKTRLNLNLRLANFESKLSHEAAGAIAFFRRNFPHSKISRAEIEEMYRIWESGPRRVQTDVERAADSKNPSTLVKGTYSFRNFMIDYLSVRRSMGRPTNSDQMERVMKSMFLKRFGVARSMGASLYRIPSTGTSYQEIYRRAKSEQKLNNRESQQELIRFVFGTFVNWEAEKEFIPSVRAAIRFVNRPITVLELSKALDAHRGTPNREILERIARQRRIDVVAPRIARIIQTFMRELNDIELTLGSSTSRDNVDKQTNDWIISTLGIKRNQLYLFDLCLQYLGNRRLP